MASSDNTHLNPQNYGSNGNTSHNYNFDKKNSGNIPLLDLSEEVIGPQAIKLKKKIKAPTKR